MNPAENLHPAGVCWIQVSKKIRNFSLNVMFLKENKLAEDTLSFTVELLLLTGEEGDTIPRRIITKHMVFGQKFLEISQIIF